MAVKKIEGYLPNDQPPFGRMVVLGFQHVLTMFPATVLVVGIGGHLGYGGNLPIPFMTGIFPDGLPAIATAAVLGILLNIIFLIFKAPKEATLEVTELED